MKHFDKPRTEIGSWAAMIPLEERLQLALTFFLG